MAKAKLIFHVPGQYLDTHHYLALFRRLDEVFRPRGAVIEVRDRRSGPRDSAPGAAAHYDDGDLHIVDMGRIRGPGILNAAISYIPPYWHLDPLGVQAESSIGAKTYDARKVDYGVAGPFYEAMRADLAAARKSRRDQMDRVTEFAPGAIAVFLQGLRPLQQGLAYCTPLELLRAVCKGAGGRQVIVKPHPLAAEEDAEVIDEALAEGLPMTVTMANVHDIIAGSVCTVSFNSAVALEGFLHRKPAILFGQSDFHHICETVREPGAFSGALARVLAREPGGYAQFMFWYLGMNCLHLYGPAFEARVMAIFEAAGFGAERLGLT
ncbi:MAG: hypothetical protein RLZZ437_1763 [Pseudomonadota bacterium]